MLQGCRAAGCRAAGLSSRPGPTLEEQGQAESHHTRGPWDGPSVQEQLGCVRRRGLPVWVSSWNLLHEEKAVSQQRGEGKALQSDGQRGMGRGQG